MSSSNGRKGDDRAWALALTGEALRAFADETTSVDVKALARRSPTPPVEAKPRARSRNGTVVGARRLTRHGTVVAATPVARPADVRPHERVRREPRRETPKGDGAQRRTRAQPASAPAVKPATSWARVVIAAIFAFAAAVAVVLITRALLN